MYCIRKLKVDIILIRYGDFFLNHPEFIVFRLESWLLLVLPWINEEASAFKINLLQNNIRISILLKFQLIRRRFNVLSTVSSIFYRLFLCHFFGGQKVTQKTLRLGLFFPLELFSLIRLRRTAEFCAACPPKNDWISSYLGKQSFFLTACPKQAQNRKSASSQPSGCYPFRDSLPSNNSSVVSIKFVGSTITIKAS